MTMNIYDTCGHNCHLLRTGVQCSPCQFKETQNNQNDTTMKNIIYQRTNEVYKLGEITVLNCHFDSEKSFLEYLKENVKMPFIAFFRFENSIFNFNDEAEIKTKIQSIYGKYIDKAIVIHLTPKITKGHLGNHIARKANAIIQ